MRCNVLWLLLLLPGVAHAEQGCPPGFYPGGTVPNGPICVPAPGYGTTNNTTPVSPGNTGGAFALPGWANRFGAIAIDDAAKEGGVGTSEGLPSKSKARAAALAQCRATGGGAGCKVKAQYRNGCGAIAWGDTRYSTATGHDKETATSLAIEDCGKYTSNCKIYYADCSLPERKWSGS